jgi:hypothetical protein
MDATPKSILPGFIARLAEHAENLAKTEDFRLRVHYADDIFSLLDTIECEVERVILAGPPQHNYSVTEITVDGLGAGTVSASLNLCPAPAGPTTGEPPEAQPQRHRDLKPRRLPFRSLTLAQAAKVVLREHGQLHGKEIERRLREGGYKTKARYFQAGMLGAFERDGGFINIGGNTWKLKPEAANGNRNPYNPDNAPVVRLGPEGARAIDEQT